MEFFEYFAPSHLISNQMTLCWRFRYSNQYYKWKLADLYRKKIIYALQFIHCFMFN